MVTADDDTGRDADIIEGLETEPKIKPDIIESRPIRPTKDLHVESKQQPVLQEVP